MSRKRYPSSSITRRRFLQGAALAGAALAGAPAYVSCRAPSEKLNIAIIGSGGRGAANMRPMLGENIVALCDVSEEHRQGRGVDEVPDGHPRIDLIVLRTLEHRPSIPSRDMIRSSRPLARAASIPLATAGASETTAS